MHEFSRTRATVYFGQITADQQRRLHQCPEAARKAISSAGSQQEAEPEMNFVFFKRHAAVADFKHVRIVPSCLI